VKVITVTNRKGGVGKTTMAVHIAAGLAIRGKRVGLVDTDSQGHAGLMLGMNEENGLFDVMIGGRPVEETIRCVPPERYSPADRPPLGALWLLPSSDNTYKIPYELDPGAAFAFLDVVNAFVDAQALDVVIVDTNPTMSLFDGSVYMATDGFIYVTECERLSFDGVAKAIAQMLRLGKSREKYLNRSCELVGIIPNKLKAGTVLHRHNIAHLKQSFGDVVWTPVTHRIAWAEATNLGETVYTYAPDGQEAMDAWYLVGQTERTLAAWQTKTG